MCHMFIFLLLAKTGPANISPRMTIKRELTWVIIMLTLLVVVKISEEAPRALGKFLLQFLTVTKVRGLRALGQWTRMICQTCL